MTSIQDRHAFESFNRFMQGLYNGGYKINFYTKGCQAGEDD